MKLLNPPTSRQTALLDRRRIEPFREAARAYEGRATPVAPVPPGVVLKRRYGGEPALSQLLRGGSFMMIAIVILVALIMMCGLFIATPALIGLGVPAWMLLVAIVIMFVGIICLAFGTMGIADG